MLRYFLLLFVLAIYSPAFAQEIIIGQEYPKSDFRPPLDLPPVISGSFGELRAGHFHSGMDYKTNQREGYPVYAVADGYISRLRVQGVGFGNAIYITHPNGFTTVYGHLQRFNDHIAQTIKNYQYRIESFEVDFPLIPIEIPVKKGEIIAWSGNSGSSGGPHLHFEIRDSQTEETINPQLFGLTVPDRVKPIINGMYVYHLNGLPFSEKTPKQYFPVTGSAGVYKLNQSQVINLNGEVGFGIMTFDKNSASENPVGVYSIELFIDGKSIYTSVWERFFFHHSRSINSHLDYPAYISSRVRIQKSFVEPGNFLTLYKDGLASGLVNITDNLVHDVNYVVKDVAGNTSNLSFRIKGNSQAEILPAKAPASMTTFFFDKENRFETPEFKLLAPKGSFYSNLNFSYQISAKPPGAFSKMHHVHNRLIPVNDALTIWIRADSTLKPELRDKAVLVNSRGGSPGGTYEDGFIKATTRDFGNYYVKTDTIPPRITPVNITDGKILTGTSRISFKISDNLSGLGSYRATIDGRWILMEYDAKRALLWHTFDENTTGGVHQLQLVISDMKSNISTFNARFIR
ncbi:M23 family metallopeptidase [Flavihumibacter sp. R14]|nr:M23 family metallopeptidase [Flavihumibacter soli]